MTNIKWLKLTSHRTGNIVNHQLWCPETGAANHKAPIVHASVNLQPPLSQSWKESVKPQPRRFDLVLQPRYLFKAITGVLQQTAHKWPQESGDLCSLHQLSISLKCKGISNLSKPRKQGSFSARLGCFGGLLPSATANQIPTDPIF